MKGIVSPEIFFYTANFYFIMATLFCVYVRWRHKCPEFASDIAYYYPAYKEAMTVGILLALEFPYLLHINSGDALLFARAYNVIAYPLYLYILLEKFIFYTKFTATRKLMLSAIPLIVLVPLFYFALLGGNVLKDYAQIIMYIAIAIFLVINFIGIQTFNKMYKIARKKDEDEYSNTQEFTTKIAQELLITFPIIIVITVLLPSLFSSQWIKMVRDIVLGSFNVWVLGECLVSNRPYKNLPRYEKGTNNDENEDKPIENEHQRQLLKDIVQSILENELYKIASLKMDEVVASVHSNRKYVSSAISSSRWQSFYRLVNSFRVICALEIQKNDPYIKQEDLASKVGFTSRYTLSRWLKLQKNGELPDFDEDIKTNIKNHLP